MKETKKPRPYDFAWMANQAYHSRNDIIPPPGWSCPRQHEYNTGFSCTVFVNFFRKQVVIAVKGTNPKNLFDLKKDADLVADRIKNWYDKSLSEMPLEERLEKLGLVYEEQQKIHHDCTFYLTGHSLGAITAELFAMKQDLEAVTFDSPGSGEYAKNNRINYPKANEKKINSLSWSAASY